VVRCVSAFCVLFAGFLLFAAPYIVYLSWASGQWGSVSRKAGVTLQISLMESGLLDAGALQSTGELQSLGLIDFAMRHPLLYAKKIALDIPKSVLVYAEALYFAYVPFLFIGLFGVFRERFWLRKDFLLLTFLMFYLLGFTLIYVNLRYSLQLVPVSLGWTAAGLLACWVYFKSSLSRQRFVALSTAAALIVVASTLAKTLQPIALEKAHVRAAGEYLKSVKNSESPKILVFDDRIPFYAEATPILIQDLKEPSDLVTYLRDRKADYLATEARVWQERYPEIARNPQDYGLILDKEFYGSRKDRVIIFRVI
jgi:hypothetical protein